MGLGELLSVEVEVVFRLLILFEATGSRSHIMGVPIRGPPGLPPPDLWWCRVAFLCSVVLKWRLR